MYFLLGVSLKFAFLLIVNLIAALISAGIWRLIAGPIAALSARSRAQIIFALRVGPVAAALIFVFAFIVPAYLLHEPENSGEVVSVKLAIIAGLSWLAIVVALYRVFKTWRVTRDLAFSWQKESSEISIEGIDVPTFKIVHPFPVIAVIGILRPKIYVAEQVLSSLTADELQAAMAHEYGHMKSHDNLKRTILRICRDLLIIPIGADLDRAWAENAETAADEYAAGLGRSTALDLASALVKLARIAPTHLGGATLAASYLFDEQNADVSDRVRRLLRFADGNDAKDIRRFAAPAWIWSVAFIGLLILHFADRRLLLTTHEAIENFVWMIQ